MRKVQRPHRCAQCGRRYTKAQWRRNDFWCPKCKKFVCYDCVSRGFICPACGTKTSRNIKKGAGYGAGLGTMFVLLSVFVLALSSFDLEGLYFVWVWMAIGTPLIFASVILYTLNKKQVRMHQAYLSGLPSGTIPLDRRTGYGDPRVQQKWREANLAMSPRRSVMMKETYPDHIYYGLLGDWDFPAMSKQERISMTAGIQRKGRVWSGGTIGLGIFIMGLGIFVVQNVVGLLVGILVILVGSLMVFIAGYARQMVQSDAEAKVTVFWKTVGFRTAKEAVEKFLGEQGLESKLTTKELPMWQHPEHRYELPDGNRISFTYSEDNSGHVYGWIEIGFRPSGALAARRLQKELDEFLNKRDLIRRIG